MASLRYPACLLSLLTVLVCSSAAEPNPLLDPNDLPPYPISGSPAVPTHSQQERQSLPKGALPIPIDASAEEQALIREMNDLRILLDSAETKAYHDDPALLLSDTYQEKAHEWVMSKHLHRFNASYNFPRPQTKEAQTRLDNIIRLINTLLFIELANHPKFLPLFASFFDAADQMRKTNKTVFPQIYDYARNDKLINYPSESPPPPISSLKEYLTELNKRYPLLLSKLDELKTEAAIEPDVFAGLKFGDLYRLLDGIAQTAVEMRTPPEVKDLRQNLRRKHIQLANLRANRAHQPPNP